VQKEAKPPNIAFSLIPSMPFSRSRTLCAKFSS
jgi:hypothetical protein